MSYSRKQSDWSISTNRILSYAVANSGFIKDEIVEIKITPSTTGKGQIVQTTNTHVIVQHVSGVYDEGENLTINNGSIFGTESLTNTALTDVTY